VEYTLMFTAFELRINASFDSGGDFRSRFRCGVHLFFDSCDGGL
jgi:hypothetical protein